MPMAMPSLTQILSREHVPWKRDSFQLIQMATLFTTAGLPRLPRLWVNVMALNMCAFLRLTKAMALKKYRALPPRRLLMIRFASYFIRHNPRRISIGLFPFPLFRDARWSQPRKASNRRDDRRRSRDRRNDLGPPRK